MPLLRLLLALPLGDPEENGQMCDSERARARGLRGGISPGALIQGGLALHRRSNSSVLGFTLTNSPAHRICIV